ncbi:MAG: ribbon-helix-helix domain-containing protein [Flavobacteriales bacterium]|jgi:predicted DNA binding CopG/RHH family protein
MTNTNTTPDTRERVLTVRVTFQDLDTLKRKARKEGTTMSTIIRQALEKVDGK